MIVLTIARLTLAEAARRRLFLVLIILTAIAVVLTGWGFSQLSSVNIRTGGDVTPEAARSLVVSQVLILVTFMFSFVLALGAAFISAPVMAEDLESGVILAVLARPVRRVELLLGKWLGVLILIAGYAVISGVIELLVVDLTTGYVPPEPVQAVVLLVAEATVLLTLTVALSTRISAIASGIIAVVLFGVTWILGIVGGIGDAFDTPQLSFVGSVGRTLLPTDALWRGAVFHLEPAAVLLAYEQAGRNVAAIFPFAATQPLAPAFLAWCAAWVGIVLGIGWLSFRRREL